MKTERQVPKLRSQIRRVQSFAAVINLSPSLEFNYGSITLILLVCPNKGYSKFDSSFLTSLIKQQMSPSSYPAYVLFPAKQKLHIA